MRTREVLLASASPRRQELLRQIGVSFRVVNHALDEVRRANEAPRKFVARMAREKACSVLMATPADQAPVVLGADTIVVCGREVLGKPAGKSDALRMLAMLSGRQHRVYSAVAVATRECTRMALSATTVYFREIGRAEAERYWRSGEPRDKAGAYAIQGLGGVFVSRMRGSYTGVVGLPVYETAALLAQAGIGCWQDIAIAGDLEQ